MQKLAVVENELVPVYQAENGEKVVYGSELYKALGVKSNYREWAKRRFCDIDAKENEEFQAFVENSTKPQGGRPAQDYIIKLDTAKEMAMLERNDKGKQVRRYFIEIEKRYKNTSIELSDMSPELRAIIMHDRKIQQVEHKIDHVNQELQDFKQDLPILGIEIERITVAVKKKGTACLGGKDSAAYHDKSLRGKVYSDIYRELKRQFGVNTYKAIKRNQCDFAVRVVNNYELPYILDEQVQGCNAQMRLEVM